VLIGATGTIGSCFCAALPARGDERVALSRDPEWARGALGDQVAVASRYSERAMARLRDSRVQATRLLATTLRELTGDSRPAVLISVGDRLLRQRQRDVLGDR
jgi:NAD dependent epimerase/dehydratase family enzyme